MNKAEFVDLVKDVGGSESKKDAEKAVSAFTAAVEQALKKKQNVILVGFGTFEPVIQKGKTGTVPGSTKTYKTTDKYVPKFKPGKTLKESVSKIKVK